MRKHNKVQFKDSPDESVPGQSNDARSEIYRDAPESIQADLNLIVSRALQATKKGSEQELTLVEILNAYDQIVQDDDTNADIYDPQILPEHRSKIYLQLLKLRQTQERSELTKLSSDMMQFQSMRSSKGPYQPHSSLKASSIYDQIQDSLDSQRRKRQGLESQMIPERQSNKEPVHVSKNQYVTFSHEDEFQGQAQGMKVALFSEEAALRSSGGSNHRQNQIVKKGQKQRPSSQLNHKFKSSRILASSQAQKYTDQIKDAKSPLRFQCQKRKPANSKEAKERRELKAITSVSSELLPKRKYVSSRRTPAIGYQPKKPLEQQNQSKVLSAANTRPADVRQKLSRSQVHQKFLKQATEFEGQNCIINITKEDRSRSNPNSMSRSATPSQPVSKGSHSRQSQNRRTRNHIQRSMLMISNIKLSRNQSRSRTSSKGNSYEKIKSRSLSKSLKRSAAVTTGILTKNASKEIQDAYRGVPPGAVNNTRNNTYHNSAASYGDASSNSDQQVKNMSSSVSLDKKFQRRKSDPASPMSRNGELNDKSNKDLHSIQNTIERQQSRQEIREETYHANELPEIRDLNEPSTSNMNTSQLISSTNHSPVLQYKKDWDKMVNQIEDSSKTDSKAGFLEESMKRIPNELPKLSVSQLIQQAKQKITERHSSRSKGSRGDSNQARRKDRMFIQSPGSRKSSKSPVETSQTEIMGNNQSFNDTAIQSEIRQGMGSSEAQPSRKKAGLLADAPQSSWNDLSGSKPNNGGYISRHQLISSGSADLQTSYQRRYDRETARRAEQQESSPVSVNLAYALHYEVKLMRKALQCLYGHNLMRQTERLNHRIAKQRYIKQLKMKALRSLHTFFLNHFGHKNSKRQADTLYRYFLTKKVLQIWHEQWKTQSTYQLKIDKMQKQMAMRTKINVLNEWQAISLAHQLYVAQKATSVRFWESQVCKKAYLSLKFFTKFSQKEKCMNQLVYSHEKFRLGTKALLALRQNIEVQHYKKERILFAFKLYEHNCQKSVFTMFKHVCRDRTVQRRGRSIADAFLRKKLLRKYWRFCQVFRIQAAKNRLNRKLADEFRAQVLQRALFVNIQISNKIFRSIYTEGKIDRIQAENLQRRCFRTLLLYVKRRTIQLDRMPQNLAFYFYAQVWWQQQADQLQNGKFFGPKSQIRLQMHFKQKLDEYYQVKAFYALQDNYEILKVFKQARGLKIKRIIFKGLKRYAAIQAVRSHKVQVVQERRASRISCKALVALKMYSTKMKGLKLKKQQLESKRLSIRKFKILHAWQKRQRALQRIRDQKEIARQIHNRRYYQLYFGRWIKKFNHSRKKAYLESIRKAYVTEKKRNKFFTLWMQAASDSMNVQIHEQRMSMRYIEKVKKRVIDALRFSMVSKKRNTLISSIISEKHTNLLVLKSLEKWEMRFHEHVQKRALYEQVDMDYNTKLIVKAMVGLRSEVHSQKEAKIAEYILKSNINELS